MAWPYILLTIKSLYEPGFFPQRWSWISEVKLSEFMHLSTIKIALDYCNVHCQQYWEWSGSCRDTKWGLIGPFYKDPLQVKNSLNLVHMCLNTFYTNYIGFCNEIKLILQIRSRTKANTKAVIYLIKIMIFFNWF